MSDDTRTADEVVSDAIVSGLNTGHKAGYAEGRAAAMSGAVQAAQDEWNRWEPFTTSESRWRQESASIIKHAIVAISAPEAIAAAEAQVVRRWLEERRDDLLNSLSGSRDDIYIRPKIINLVAVLSDISEPAQQEAGSKTEGGGTLLDHFNNLNSGKSTEAPNISDRMPPMNRILHCWEGGPETADGCSTKCMLEADHDGPHEWTRSDEIIVMFHEADDE